MGEGGNERRRLEGGEGGGRKNRLGEGGVPKVERERWG